jgi:hypothetical protein
LTRELSSLLKEEAPQPAMKFLSGADIPGWVAEGLREAIRRKCAEETPVMRNAEPALRSHRQPH